MKEATNQPDSLVKSFIAGNFFSTGLRQKVDQLMDILWAGGVNNPSTAIEQISYLLFLRLLSNRDDLIASLDIKHHRLFSGKWARFAWGNFVTLTGDDLYNAVRDAIEHFHELPELSVTGRLLFNRATLKIYDRPTLRAIIQVIHELDLEAHDGLDIKGDMYEYLLSKLAVSGTNGQFRTPRHIINLIVAMVNPQPGQRICDPACGTAGFLIGAFQHILRQHTKHADVVKERIDGGLLKPAQWKFLEEQGFTGYDNDADMVKIGILNLYLHKLEKANIEFHNPLTIGRAGAYPGQLFEVILANPPFSGKIQKESILADLTHKLNTRATELLYLKWFIDHLAPTGRAGVIVPNGVLFGSTKAAHNIRRLLLNECDLQAVVTMPAGVFKPYAGVATAVLIFQKGSSTKSVWFYEMTADGFSLSDTRTPIENNDIPDILNKWPSRAEGHHSFRVSRDKLAEHNDELIPGRYRGKDAITVQHEKPDKIIGDILAIEERIAEKLHYLRKQLAKQ
jgi:type I restriction enzyme M protein